ncbi:MAG TPA: hypothetical protein ENN69_02000 [Spirochaetia bacterium]|nr:hypothetical protein [Spirochaetia bacterium]
MSAERLSLAETIIPGVRGLPAEGLQTALLDRTGGRGADLVITAASVPAIQEAAFSYAALNGRVMFFGGLPAGASRVTLDTNQIHYKQLTVTGTTRQSLRQYRSTLGLLAAGALAVDDLVSGTGTLDMLGGIIRDVSQGKGLKVSIKP